MAFVLPLGTLYESFQQGTKMRAAGNDSTEEAGEDRFRRELL